MFAITEGVRMCTSVLIHVSVRTHAYMTHARSQRTCLACVLRRCDKHNERGLTTVSHYPRNGCRNSGLWMWFRNPEIQVRNCGNHRIRVRNYGNHQLRARKKRYTLYVCRKFGILTRLYWKVGMPMCSMKTLRIRTTIPKIECGSLSSPRPGTSGIWDNPIRKFLLCAKANPEFPTLEIFEIWNPIPAIPNFWNKSLKCRKFGSIVGFPGWWCNTVPTMQIARRYGRIRSG